MKFEKIYADILKPSSAGDGVSVGQTMSYGGRKSLLKQ